MASVEGACRNGVQPCSGIKAENTLHEGHETYALVFWLCRTSLKKTLKPSGAERLGEGRVRLQAKMLKQYLYATKRKTYLTIIAS